MPQPRSSPLPMLGYVEQLPTWRTIWSVKAIPLSHSLGPLAAEFDDDNISDAGVLDTGAQSLDLNSRHLTRAGYDCPAIRNDLVPGASRRTSRSGARRTT